MKFQHHTRSGSTNIVYIIDAGDVDAGAFDAPRLVELRTNTPPNAEVFPPGTAAQHLTPHETVALVGLLLDGAKDAHGEPQSLFGATLSRLHGAVVAALSTQRGTVSVVDGEVVCSLCGGEVAEVDHAERYNDLHLDDEDRIIAQAGDGDWETDHFECRACDAELDFGELEIHDWLS